MLSSNDHRLRTYSGMCGFLDGQKGDSDHTWPQRKILSIGHEGNSSNIKKNISTKDKLMKNVIWDPR